MSTEKPFTIERFYKFLSQQKLMAGKCLKCEKIHLPPRPLCDNCFSEDFEWVSISGKGKLVAFTVIHVAPTQFQDLVPYAVGIIQLDNGLKIPGMIQGINQEVLKIGIELTLDFGSFSTLQQWPQWPRYYFKP